MTIEPTELSFDKATYATEGAAVSTSPPCGNCGRAIGDAYWKWQQLLVCANCRGAVESALSKSQSGASFAMAAALGTATAVGCGTAYAVVAHVLHVHLAIVTIGIAYLVAKVIRKASGGVSGLRYQILAAMLAYLAGTMAYAPDIYQAMAPLTLVKAVVAVGVMLAVPFLTITKSPFGLVIVAVGVWEAWKLTKGYPAVLEGPYQVTPPASL